MRGPRPRKPDSRGSPPTVCASNERQEALREERRRPNRFGFTLRGMSAVQCPSCSDTVLETQFFCPRGGTSLRWRPYPDRDRSASGAESGAAARTLARQRVATSGSGRPVVSGGRPGSGASSVGRVVVSKPSDERFSAGDLLLDRYRVIGLLGRGGMGEVTGPTT